MPTAQSPADGQRAAGGTEEHRLDLRQSSTPPSAPAFRRSSTSHDAATTSPAALPDARRCAARPSSGCAPRRIWPRTRSGADRIEEVTRPSAADAAGPRQPGPQRFDLWELTTLYQEVHGSAYWYLDIGPLGVPQAIWILPSQNVTPRREPDSRNLVDYYLYRTGTSEQRFRAGADHPLPLSRSARPVHGGLSPLRACFEQVVLTSDTPRSRRRSSRTTPSPTPSCRRTR